MQQSQFAKNTHNIPKIYQESFHSNFLLLPDKPKESTGFFNKRNSKGSSKQGSRKNTSTEEELSPQMLLKAPQQRNSSNFLNLSNYKPQPQRVQSSQFLPPIKKEIGSDYKQQKQNHLKFKEIQNNNNDQYVQGNLLSANVRSTSDSKINAVILKKKKNELSDRSKKSSFAISARKKTRRTLEQAVIEDIFLHDENYFGDVKDSDSSEDHIRFPDEVQQVNTKRGNFLQGHEIKEEHRARMLDWMIQVFRVLKISSPQTYFLSVSILDKYLEDMQKLKMLVSKDQLYLTGLTSIFISSKVEDVIPMRMKQVLNDAGHGKFQQEEIVRMERHMLKTLQFRFFTKTVYEEASVIFKDLIYSHKRSTLPKTDLELAYEYILFLSQLISISLELSTSPLTELTLIVVKYTFCFLKRRFKFNSKVDQSEVITDQNRQNFKIASDLKSSFAMKHLDLLHYDTQIYKQVKQQFKDFVYNEDNYSNRKNLLRNFPLFFGEQALPYTFGRKKQQLHLKN